MDWRTGVRQALDEFTHTRRVNGRHPCQHELPENWARVCEVWLFVIRHMLQTERWPDRNDPRVRIIDIEQKNILFSHVYSVSVTS